jgi:CRISPR-associated protein Cas1
MPTIGRVVHVGSAARLSYRDLQVLVERDGQPDARVPVEDLAVLVCDCAPITLTAPLLAALAQANVAVVVCGPKHLPDGLMLPLAGAALHTSILLDQIRASEPRKKRAWQAVVQAKIAAQARLLKERTGRDAGLTALIVQVGSGDTGNVEGRAARVYFRTLFGEGFVRNKDAPGINAMLNYGYALIRAATARALVGAGLHPALGIHHHNQYDAYALADDMVEPLRPLVDRRVATLCEVPPPDELTVETRAALLELLHAEVRWSGRVMPLFAALEGYAAGLREFLGGEGRKLLCPVV